MRWHHMATVVLVHGSFHGGWCWQRVVPLLEEAGHEVWTPTLTGLAERRHLLTPDVDLRMHTRDVIELLSFEDLQDVVLVGHSYGGMVISSVAAVAPSRLRRVVYLDAYLPGSGESEIDLWPEAWVADHRQALEQVLPVREPPPAELLGVEDPEDAAWVESRMTPHPLNTYTQPIPEAEETVPGAFIHCTQGALAGLFGTFAQRARDRGWPVHELATGHEAMVTKPGEVAGLLERCASGPQASAAEGAL